MKPSIYGTANRVYTLDNLFVFVLSHRICEHMDYVCLVYTPRRVSVAAVRRKIRHHTSTSICTIAHDMDEFLLVRSRVILWITLVQETTECNRHDLPAIPTTRA